MLASFFHRSENRGLGIYATGRQARPSVGVSAVRFSWQHVLFVLSLASMACEGRTTTDTLPWSCSESCTACPLTPTPAGLAGFWRFDEEDIGAQWVGSSGTQLRWSACDTQGRGEWVASDSWAGLCGTERLGGTGGSLRLNQANGYVEAPLPESLPTSSLTLAAWVSVLRPTTKRMTVMSVVRPACGSAWLDLQVMQDGQRVLILSAEAPAPSSGECLVEERTANMPSSVFDWGLGTWYNVAAVLSPDGQHTLLLDGVAISATTGTAQPSPPRAASSLRIGGDPNGEGGFEGLIDDVALFSRALSDAELREFIMAAISVRSDGQSWTAWSVNGSRASWISDCRAEAPQSSTRGATVVVDNGYWSAAGLLAQVEGGARIGRLKKATLVADIPAEESFDFVLSSDHKAERCTWHTTGTGQNRYEFTLADVNNCDCPSSCDCNFEVTEARVGTRWDEDGTVTLSACRLELEWEDAAAEFELAQGPGGMRGLNGWCWRPISFHREAAVNLDLNLTTSERTVGTLLGGNRVTAYLAADFAVDDPGAAHELCDLHEATGITIETQMPEGYSYQLRVADYTGIAREWSREWHQDQAVQNFALCSSDSNTTVDSEGNPLDCGRDVDPIPHKQRPVNLNRVRFLGVQKAFELTSEEGTIAIERVEFSGVVHGNCSVAVDPENGNIP